MKLTPKTAQLSAMAVMVLIMTFTVVFVSTLVNFGIDEAFLFRFLRGWAIAFIMAYPLVILLMPRLQKYFQGFITER
jgi:hypothetical protein